MVDFELEPDGVVDDDDLPLFVLAFDETLEDCDGDGIWDVEQIIQDVSLDMNQDGSLDACDDCVADIDGSGSVEVNDVLLLLSSWGECSPPCDADLNNDGSVDVNDVLMLLSLWGKCP